MLAIIQLLLPALLPSWRFFDVIAPSPRIQFALLQSKTETPTYWREFRPRPAQVSIIKFIIRLFWNPTRNENLFLVSCAERIIEHPTRHSEDEIFNRLVSDFRANALDVRVSELSYVKFRLLLVRREEGGLQQDVIFNSRVQSLFEDIVK